MARKYIIFIFILLLITVGCIKPPPPAPPKPQAGYPKPYMVLNKWYQPLSTSKDFVEEGIASWYGADFHGKKTSNGETYDMYGISAAHKTLPLGTIVEVHNLENDKKMNLKINDRGPFVDGRIIDLSYAAAQQLDIAKPGLSKVRVKALNVVEAETEQQTPKTKGSEYGNFFIQVGAFKSKGNAEKFKASLPIKNKEIIIATENQNGALYYKVKIVGIQTLTKALQYQQYLTNLGYSGMFIVAQ